MGVSRASLDIFFYERLAHFVNRFLHNFYDAGFGEGNVGLFKIPFFRTQKMHKR